MTRPDIDREAHELRGVFPDIGTDDFYELDNGNIGAVVYYRPDDFSFDEFEVLIEYVPGYPDVPPPAWVLEPEIDSNVEHVWEWDEHGHPMICYIDPDEWHPNLTSYDAAVMIKTWVYAYCNWKRRGEWTWDEKSHGDLDPSLWDLLPF